MSFVAVAVGGSALVGAYVSNKSAKANTQAAAKASNNAEQRLWYVQDQVDAAVKDLKDVVPPDLMQYIEPYQNAVIQGKLTPEEASTLLVKDTALKGITIPPEILAAQRESLSKITDVVNSGGLTAIDRARLADIREEQDAIARGQAGAIIQNAQQRGVSGSGLEQAQLLLNQQAAATRSARAGTDVAAEAQRRALEAMSLQGSLAGSQRTQAFNEQEQIAAAQDAIDKFNTSFQNQTNAANVTARNQAAAANLAEQQRISEFNIGQREREAAAKAAAAQNEYQNKVNQKTNVANVTAGQAGQATTANTVAQQQAANLRQTAAGQTAAAYSGAASGIGQLLDAYGRYTTPKP